MHRLVAIKEKLVALSIEVEEIIANSHIHTQAPVIDERIEKYLKPVSNRGRKQKGWKRCSYSKHLSKLGLTYRDITEECNDPNICPASISWFMTGKTNITKENIRLIEKIAKASYLCVVELLEMIPKKEEKC